MKRRQYARLPGRFLPTFSILFLLLFPQISQAATGQPSIYVDGRKLAGDVAPLLEEGRLLVPFRAVFESLQGPVEWRPAQKMIVARHGLLDLRMQVGVRTARLGNRDIPLDVPPRIVQGRNLVPLRLISERLFAADVRWQADNKSVYISSKGPRDLRPLTAGFQAAIGGSGSQAMIDVSQLGVMDVREIIPDRTPPLPVTLLFSDSPEYVDQPGVTYRGSASGHVRLVYYHIHRFPTPARLSLVAHNPGSKPATIQVTRQVSGDRLPERTAWQDLGARVTLDYLDPVFLSPQKTYRLAPGDSLIMNPQAAEYLPGELIYGITDLETDQELSFSFLVLPPAETEAILEQAAGPVLPADGRHDRGTFAAADQQITVTAGAEISGFLLGDGFSDTDLAGTDQSSGTAARLRGNYGVSYQIRANIAHPSTALFIPLGGSVFSGGLAAPSGLFRFQKAPSFSQALSLGSFTAGDTAEWRFMPPAGSCLPVLLVFVPQEGTAADLASIAEGSQSD